MSPPKSTTLTMTSRSRAKGPEIGLPSTRTTRMRRIRFPDRLPVGRDHDQREVEHRKRDPDEVAREDLGGRGMQQGDPHYGQRHDSEGRYGEEDTVDDRRPHPLRPRGERVKVAVVRLVAGDRVRKAHRRRRGEICGAQANGRRRPAQPAVPPMISRAMPATAGTTEIQSSMTPSPLSQTARLLPTRAITAPSAASATAPIRSRRPIRLKRPASRRSSRSVAIRRSVARAPNRQTARYPPRPGPR